MSLRDQILSVHRPVHGYCIICDADRDVGADGNNPECPHFPTYCREDDRPWPCPTVRIVGWRR